MLRKVLFGITIISIILALAVWGYYWFFMNNNDLYYHYGDEFVLKGGIVYG